METQQATPALLERLKLLTGNNAGDDFTFILQQPQKVSDDLHSLTLNHILELLPLSMTAHMVFIVKIVTEVKNIFSVEFGSEVVNEVTV